jgi:Ca-activated chloride channel homolog
MRRVSLLSAAIVIFSLVLSVVPVVPLEAAETLSRRERKERIAALDETYLKFLDEVEPIMSRTELDVFLRMESNPQRDRFIEEFWKRRDPDPETRSNAYREAYYARRELATERYRGVKTDRGRILLLKGEPAERIEMGHCRYLRPVEVWSYPDRGRGELLLFFSTTGIDYSLWQVRNSQAPGVAPRRGSELHDALSALLNPTGESFGVARVFFDRVRLPALLRDCMGGDAVLDAILYTLIQGEQIQRVLMPPEIDEEDAKRILQTSVVSATDAPRIEAESSVSLGGARGSRTLVRLHAQVLSSSVSPVLIDGRRFYQINAVGETLQDGRMFERWQYRFDFPEGDTSGLFPLIVERALREGTWELRMKLRDPQSGAETILTELVHVPAPDSITASDDDSPAGDRSLPETRSVIRLLPPQATILTGFQSFEAIPAGEEVAGVEFYLNDTRIMRKMQPPFRLELDLGPVPRPHVVRAVALDRRRQPLDEDVLKLNDGTDPFRVRIVSPRLGRSVTGPVRVEMEPAVPSDGKLATVELHLNDERVVTLYDEPWIHTVFLPDEPQLAVLRVVATLEDETIRPVEDVVILNGPEHLERIDVRLIEVPTTVLAGGHPVRHLAREAFTVLDAGEPVELAKFELMSNQPLSIGIAIDGSASMKDRLEAARTAAMAFLERVMTPRDQTFLVSFDRRVFTLADWTSDAKVIAEGLASLRAEESTALYDAVIESLYRFVGRDGQRALILISDGSDTASRYPWKPTLEYARRMGIPIYSIGIGIPVAQIEARSRLRALAESTGGRSWLVASADELADPYRQIEQELRSQYLLGFYVREQARARGDWREITILVDGADEVRAIPGYYP